MAVCGYSEKFTPMVEVNLSGQKNSQRVTIPVVAGVANIADALYQKQMVIFYGYDNLGALLTPVAMFPSFTGYSPQTTQEEQEYINGIFNGGGSEFIVIYIAFSPFTSKQIQMMFLPALNLVELHFLILV